jgi:hypothetical protein
MSVRDWDAAVREARGEPIQFTLGGVTFDVPCPIPAFAFLDYADRTDKPDDVIAGFRDLLVEMLSPAHRPLLIAAIRDSGIGGQTLIELAKWVIEEGTVRPTERRSGSPPSPSANGAATSAGASPSRPGSRRQRTRSG